MRNTKEKGAIVIEATLSLTAFVFVLFTILMIVNMAYAQSRIGIALNTAAKEISQYSHLYFKLGAASAEQNLEADIADERQLVNETIGGVETLIDTFSDVQGSISTADFESMVDSAQNGATTVDSLVTQYADRIADDPKGFIFGMGKLVLADGYSELKTVLGQAVAKAFMKKNLKAFAEDDPDDFLRRYRVKDGMAGLNFEYTALFPQGTDTIQLVVTYKIVAVRLLNVDLSFTIRQCAKTTAWDNGHSVIQKTSSPGASKPEEEKQSLWDENDQMGRGTIIVLEEKKKFTYTSTGQGIDAYENAGGKNTFVSITTKNTFLTSYSTVKGLKGALSADFSKLYSAVGKIPEDFTVMNKFGSSVPVTSPEKTRTYKMVLVVPENADKNLVETAIAQFEAERASLGDKVEVVPVYGYGSYHGAEASGK